jgi:hypothetical protein
LTEEQSSAVHIQAFVSADGIYANNDLIHPILIVAKKYCEGTDYWSNKMKQIGNIDLHLRIWRGLELFGENCFNNVSANDFLEFNMLIINS